MALVLLAAGALALIYASIMGALEATGRWIAPDAAMPAAALGALLFVAGIILAAVG